MLGWLVAAVGAAGLAIIIGGMIAIVGADRTFNHHYWKCTNETCEHVWISRFKHCPHCGTRGKPRR